MVAVRTVEETRTAIADMTVRGAPAIGVTAAYGMALCAAGLPDDEEAFFSGLRKGADLLISDYSGVVFDFALVFDKPVIYADVSFDFEPYDAGWLDNEMWTFRALPKVGVQLTQENAGRLPELIEEVLHSEQFAEGRKEAIAETWANTGNSVPAIADYLVAARQRILEGGSGSNGKKQDS